MGDTNNSDCARQLVDSGLTIFPCHAQTRDPMVAWGTQSSKDPAIVAQWWRQWPAALPALDLGKCGLVVLDGDRHHPRTDGVAELRALLGRQPDLDVRKLPMVRTPRDGVHVYFAQSNPPLRNSRGRLPEGIDVRGAGGFVIAPGATRADGRGYRWIHGQPSLGDRDAIPQMPAALVALIGQRPRASASHAYAASPPTARQRAYALAALGRIAKELAGTANGDRNNACNKAAWTLGRMAARGWLSDEEISAALTAAMEANGYAAEEGDKAVAATIASGVKAGRLDPHEGLDSDAITLDDFVAYQPAHYFVFLPCKELWPAISVDSRLGKIPVVTAGGEEKDIPASRWLDLHRSVEQMTWTPGEDTLIRDRLVVDGGWIARPGVTTLNLYRPPTIEHGNAVEAERWLDHVHKVYPADADHLIRWLAHRVQRPAEKVNHALVLGGAQGIGKDTLLEPVKHAVGPWNFLEVGPSALLGRFNGFLKAVVLRISEARGSGRGQPLPIL
jgi:hypothetical protein